MSRPKSTSLNPRKCEECGLSAWACNKLQDLVYEKSGNERRKLAIEIRKDTSEFISTYYISKAEVLKAIEKIQERDGDIYTGFSEILKELGL